MLYVALENHWERSRSVGLSNATTRAPRGLRCSVNRLMVPPLPAASRPSNRTTTFPPRRLDPLLNLQQLDLQLGLLPLIGLAADFLLVRVLPGFEDSPDGVAVAPQFRQALLRSRVQASRDLPLVPVISVARGLSCRRLQRVCRICLVPSGTGIGF